MLHRRSVLCLAALLGIACSAFGQGRDCQRSSFGLTPLSFGTVESFDGKREHLLIMTLYPLSFDEVEAAAVKGHGHSACPMPDTSNGRNCFVFMRKSGEWTTRLVVRQYGDKAGIGCSYMRTRG